jgi:predicted transcriptional regulator
MSVDIGNRLRHLRLAHNLSQRELAKRTGVTPSRLVLYWTGEFDKKQARMVFDYNPADVEQAATHFREVVGKIQALEFDVVTPPDKKTCSECDFRSYCASDGTISAKYLK